MGQVFHRNPKHKYPVAVDDDGPYIIDRDGVAPNPICIGKGLGAGYQPIGALLASAKIYDAAVIGSGFLQHGHTYTGHAAACAGALAVQRAIKQRGL